MDMKDLEKELGDLKMPLAKPGKRIDHGVRHAGLKAAASKALAVMFILAMALFAYYTVINANDIKMDAKIVFALATLYLALGAFISFRLWNLDFIGWLALFFISLAGIGLPAMSAVTRGIAVGTVPIIAVSLVTLATLWWIKDLYRVKKFGDIFAPPQ